MAEKQYYVKINFDFGVDNGDGTFTSKNPGEAAWLSMPMTDVVALQNYAIIPALNMISTRAGELGMMVTGIEMPSFESDKIKPAK